jgi:uncharacterized phage protein (TIGR01671 family)
MREIKFRGKSIDEEKTGWFYGDYCSVPDPNILFEDLDGEIDCEPIVPETVGQYTGLQDKNGKGIYEGDLVEYTRVNYTDCSRQEIESIEEVICGEIYYAEGLWLGIRLINRTGKLFLPGMASSDIPNIELEIIGNIYENPELLEVKA